ncbi:hypothetical protein [Chishuiella sp.]|uniref:hypothetical protein n=1 Tax=Chishuiella sp. TaxID=1969467 RepID=UPI0028AA6CD5|nr:hypothetical protein [Chishuiella sp.]
MKAKEMTPSQWVDFKLLFTTKDGLIRLINNILKFEKVKQRIDFYNEALIYIGKS